MEAKDRQPSDYERHLESAQRKKGQREQISDSPRRFRGSVKRIVGGHEVSVPIVAQGAFEIDNQPSVVLQVNTQGRLKKPTPQERAAIEAALGRQDPQTLKEVRRQQAAIEHRRKRQEPK